MPVIGTQYSYAYNHARKEIIFKVHIGTNIPIEIVMSVDGFFADMDFIKEDQKLAHWLGEVRTMKELPANHDFGPGGGVIRFDPKDWEGKMGND